jgi:outer membrane protein assembly factor BamB
LTPDGLPAQVAGVFSRIVQLGLLTFVSLPALAEDWPQWRGPDRTGHVPAGWKIPATLPAEPKVLWRIKTGDGLASPVVAGGRVFYLDNQNGVETVHAADATTGRLLWSAPLDAAFKDSQSASGPRCTPVVDGDHLYAQSCRGELRCLSTADGALRWRVNFVTNFGGAFIGEKGQAAGATRHGFTAAPLIHGRHLIALAGGTNGAGIVCLDKLDGREIWKSQNDSAAYAPPILARLAGREQIIAFVAEALLAVAPADGKPLWRVPFKTTYARHVTTPVVVGDTVMISSHEFGLVGVRVVETAGALTATPAWTNKEAAINFASPVAVGRHLYGLGPTKNLISVEAATGRLAWSQDGLLATAASKAHASFLVAGGNILALTDSGQLVLFAADPAEFRERGRAQVCGQTWCNPAYARGNLWLRDGRELLCVELTP